MRARQLGASVLLIEKDALGGTCLNRGCIPTKSLLWSAEILTATRRAAEYGVRLSAPAWDQAGAVRRKDRMVQTLQTGLRNVVTKHGVEIRQGAGTLLPPGPGRSRRVAVRATDGASGTVTARRAVIIAAGSSASAPKAFPVDGVSVLTSDHALGLTAAPASLLIVGAGAVGLEFATLFHRAGSEVALVEMAPRVAPGEDEEMSGELASYLARQGIAVHVNTPVALVNHLGDKVRVVLGGAEKREMLVEKVLVAAGRTPQADHVGVSAAGVRVKGGRIEVNQSMQTNVRGIYAIGDLAVVAGAKSPGYSQGGGHRDLAHAAAAEGAVAVEHALRGRARVNYAALPNCIFCEPQLASVGLTEAAARKKFRKIRVGRCPFLSVSKATLHGERAGLVKVIGGPDGRLVGVHILGPSATELINIASAAIQARAHLEDLARMSFVHPSLAESLHIAAEDALGRAIDLPPRG